VRKRSTLAAAGVLTSLLAFGAPAEAAPGAGEGYSCGMTAVSLDGQSWNGVMEGGPWWVEPSGAPAQMRCELQRFNGEIWETIAVAEGPIGPGTAAVPPTRVGFHTPLDGVMSAMDLLPTNLQMCTQITVYEDPQQPRVEPVDADDDPSNGGQCEKEERADGELVYVTLFPPRAHGGDRCVFVTDEGVPPQVPDENCVPLPV